MTAILVDKYKGEIFIFADGRLTSGDFLVSDTTNKVFKIDANTIWAGCGDMRLDEMFKQLADTNNINTQTVRQLGFDGTFYLVTGNEITVIECVEKHEKESPSKSGIFKLSVDALPIFDGSGREVLSGAYDTLQPHKAKSRQEYIEKVKQCFNNGCRRVTSVGELYSFESVRIRE